jgi:hypothetical protein
MIIEATTGFAARNPAPLESSVPSVVTSFSTAFDISAGDAHQS